VEFLYVVTLFGLITGVGMGLFFYADIAQSSSYKAMLSPTCENWHILYQLFRPAS